MKNLVPYQMWCGSEESYHTYMHALESFNEFMKDKKEDDIFAAALPYTKVGKVGVVSISGSLIPGEVPKIAADWFGVMGYDNIKQAIVAALSDKDVKSIQLRVGSGGGAVQGLKATADFLAEAGKIKPVYTYSDSMMASAAYWLGSTAEHVSVGDMANVGSIGTIAVQTEVTEMRKSAGITDTVIRSGKYKALGHPFEKLTQEAHDQIQERLDYMTSKFVAAVAENRGRSPEVVDSVMGQGRVFMGEQALAVGLVDTVETEQEALARAGSGTKRAKVTPAVASNPAENASSEHNSPSQSTEDQTMLTEAQKQALAAGASLESVLAMTAEETPEQPAANTAPEADVPEAEPEDANAKALETLQAELAALKSTSAATEAALAAASAEVEAQKSIADGLCKIVAGITNSMNVAMSRAKVDYTSADVGAAYASTLAEFKQKFPVGGAAANTQKPEEAPKAALPVSPREWEAARNLFKSN